MFFEENFSFLEEIEQSQREKLEEVLVISKMLDYSIEFIDEAECEINVIRKNGKELNVVGKKKVIRMILSIEKEGKRNLIEFTINKDDKYIIEMNLHVDIHVYTFSFSKGIKILLELFI